MKIDKLSSSLIIFGIFCVACCGGMAADKTDEKLSSLTAQVNAVLNEFKIAKLTHEQLSMLILEGLIEKGAPDRFANEGEIKKFIVELATNERLTLPVKITKESNGGDYTFNVDLPTEFIVKGPPRTRICLRVFYMINGSKSDWIDITIANIVLKR